jgi:hypothetical protein
MKPIKAFVAHSFAAADKPVIQTFLDYLDEITRAHPSFSWQHAERARSIGVDDKVLSLIRDANVFIAICTICEYVIADDSRKGNWVIRYFPHVNTTVASKTSDWIIQEIGITVTAY